jgi:hypothetical protein
VRLSEEKESDGKDLEGKMRVMKMKTMMGKTMCGNVGIAVILLSPWLGLYQQNALHS